MIEKRSIEEILKSIFLLVNEAKSKNKQIESSFKTEDSLNKTLVFNNLDKSILEEKKTYSNWENIKFTKETKKKSNFDVKETLINKIKVKSELKFKIEIEKWVKNKVPRILDKQLKQYTNDLLKK